MINIIVLAPLTTVDAIRQKLEDGTLSPEQAKAIASRVDVVYRHPTDYRAFDIYTDKEGIEAMKDHDWKLVGMWDTETGELLSAFNEEAYLSIMPDELETDEEGNVISRTRPTVPRDIHLRAGQAGRKFS